MTVKDIRYEDFLQYKEPCMFIICPKCSFKCDYEYGTQICQNWSVASLPDIIVDDEIIIQKYLGNDITHSVVFSGLEPLDSFSEVLSFIDKFRNYTDDMIAIYSGYNKTEVVDKIEQLKRYKNIIIKFGRYIPNSNSIYDEVLGQYLASDNQYAEKIS